MYATITKTRSSLLLFLFVLLVPFKVLAQNPTVSLSGGPCTGSTLTVTSSATPTQVVFLLNGSAVTTSTSLTYVANAAGTYTATVTTATGSATTTGVVITALTTPSIVISAIPGSTNICAGTNINFNATVTTPGTAPAYQWKRNNNPVGTNSPTFSTAAIANGDVISCTLTSNAACASPTTASSNNITYTVVTPVTPSISITSITGTSTCSGTPATFVATGVNGGSTPSYQWYVNSVLTATTTVDTFTSTSLNNHDTVVCKMVTSVPCATVETAVSNGIIMAVSTSVIPTISIAASPGTTICSGTPVTFTASGTNGGANIQYQWYKDGLQIAGATNTTYQSSTLANNDSIRCTMTSNATCATATLVSSNEVTMTVNAIGAPTISIAPNNGTSVCMNDTVVFTATTTFGGTAPMYTWIKNGAVVSGPGAANSIQLIGLSNNDTVSCVLTSNQVCATTNTATSNKVVMTVSPHVTMTLSITANPGNSITAGQVVVFTATAANTGSSFGYQWYVNGVAKTGSISPTYSTNTLANNDIVTCKVTTTEPCVASPIVTSNAITMNVNSGVAVVGKGTLSLGLYPNPNTGNFNVKGTITDVTKEADIVVLNLLGQIVYSDTVTVQNGNFDHGVSLPASAVNGLYLLKFTTVNASEILKFSMNR